MADSIELALIFGTHYVELYDASLDTGIHVDFVNGPLAHRQRFGGGRGQTLARAIGIKQGKSPRVLDATAGLAKDAYIMASLGCDVVLVERSPVLVTLLRDGIQRGLATEPSASIINNHFQLIEGDSIEVMSNLARKPDVIYIDPMYPERTKSALVKKDMQILQKLLGKNQNIDSLLSAALQHAGQRVVVKRPRHADTSHVAKPVSSISSKTTRYDIYPVN